MKINKFQKLKLFFIFLFANFIRDIQAKQANIALLYENNDSDMETIFEVAINKANEEYDEPRFYGLIIPIEPNDAFEASKKLCQILDEKNIVAVFGPKTSKAAEHAMSLCDVKQLPFIDTRWNFNVQLPTLNLHPHPSQLAVALKDLVTAMDWNGGFTILYESGEYLSLVSELLQMYGVYGPSIMLYRYEVDLSGNYHKILRSIRSSGETSFVVVGSPATLSDLLNQAQQAGIMNKNYRYIIGSLDFQTLYLDQFQHGETNIISMRWISLEEEYVEDVVNAWFAQQNYFQNVSCPLTSNMAVIYDGVQLLAETFKHMPVEAVPLNCNDNTTWDKGNAVLDHMKSLNTTGLTGKIKFDQQGLRTEFILDIVELTESGLQKIGTWKSDKGITIQRLESLNLMESSQISLANKRLIVITAISEPYAMLENISNTIEGNYSYEGFGIDLIKELGKKLGFSYTFRLQEDGIYGSLNTKTYTWNGMIQEIMEERADLAITDLTITSDRESAVDFTVPFMNLGIGILFHKPMKEPPKLFSLMSPFSGEVWLCLALAYVAVSLVMFILARISSREWQTLYPYIEERSELRNQFTFINCFWYAVGILFQQGSELAPTGFSTRAVASFWSFFTLILVASYTANLAALFTTGFLTESSSPSIINVEDLAANKFGINYGVKLGGSTFAFFKDSKYPTYQKIYEFMSSHPEFLATSTAEGTERVENENYAFFMESTTIEYITERRCILQQVGPLLNEKGYGIAMRKNSPYRHILSQAILELQEEGVLKRLKTKWWQEERGGGACAKQDTDVDTVAELGLVNVGGIFVVLVLGCIIAACFGILEWMLHIYATRGK